ncbi:MAG: TIGR02302 family protein, partial [Marinosulfonomonas sp.]|nr:TIGR02302 family protein [Marinosulfonomonas sp.]
GDPASELVWQAHIKRMAERAALAKAVKPDLRIAALDPFALRYMAILAFVMALIFGSVLRVASVAELAPGQGSYAGGPTWEGWIEPPAYTGKPSIYLADIKAEHLTVPAGSFVTLRLYGEIGELSVVESISGRIGEAETAAEPAQGFDITQSGELVIKGPGGRSWTIEVTPDAPPTIDLVGELERRVGGDMRLPFVAEDDYGIIKGRAELSLDLASVDRRYGLVVAPEPRETILLDLPIPISGNRREFEETLIENLAEHPWAGLPIKLSLFIEDAAAQIGKNTPETVILPGRRFFDPLAAALIEQRRDLLWSRKNAGRVVQVLRATSHRPDGFFRSDTAYLKLRFAIRQLEIGQEYTSLSEAKRDEVAQALWDIALVIEDGNLSDARERLRRAQERLEQAMQDGATDDEIAELMEELRQAMQDFMQQLAQQDPQNNELADNQNTQEITGDQLQAMLDRLQELMEQGRMAEAQELMDQLRQMMENMQMAQNQQGQGEQSPGQQAMEGLADTLRQQQGLNDDTFSDLQDQFGEDGQQGEQGQQGQGQQGPGRQGQGSQGQGQQPGEGNEPGQGLADRQQALRDLLNQQAGNLPGAGTPGGDTARDALGRAGRAMEGAEDALRQKDYAGALDNQADALEALRDGMRGLAEEMARQQQQGQQGEAFGRAATDNNRDPLGRDTGSSGQAGTDEQMMQGEDIYRRAQELLNEIRRRSSEPDRPDVELDYLKRLLDRF